MSGRRVGIFGGSFNPVHRGHVNSMLTMIQKMNLDRLLVIPAFHSPHREFIVNPTPIQRMEMVQLAIAAESNRLELVDLEIKREGVSYTADTLQELVKTQGENELFLIIGLDQLEHFDQWKDVEEILTLSHLIVTSRTGSSFPESLEDMPEGLQEYVDTFGDQKIQMITGKELFFVQLDDIDVSSTDIRKRLYMGQDTKGYIHPEVEDYIHLHHIYEKGSQKVGDYEEFTRFCADLVFDKKGLGVQAFDVGALEQPSEFTLIASGMSTRHTTALGDNIVRQVKAKYGLSPQSVEGLKEGRWVVLDYGSLIVHLFYDFTRQEYRLEELWKDGVDMKVSDRNPSDRPVAPASQGQG